MTSAEIRQSFLEFFRRHEHTIVPSASLMPDSPGLLFTNAGMNQFVPIFLNERKPDVSKWAGVDPARDTRAADTQKCIRAGGKHNDLEDVGWDTYHHTFFEMLGNWSFGDYFKKESLTWGWELLTQVWGIPAKRLFATVYAPDKAKGDPADFDQEAYDIWAGLFKKAGLDPAVHIVRGSKKDNFWMMGETGPCGPCSEIHFNLLESDDEQAGRDLVNAGSPRCIEIWNHVFIQFNAGADGLFSSLPSRHVDTGLGFERVAGIHAGTKGFKDFSREPSNYYADVFTDLFAKIKELTDGQHVYTGTVPTKRESLTDQEKTDIAFRVVADHARCVCCAIADGIIPGNKASNYVIRRVLRRGILYGRKDLKLETGFFTRLVPAVAASLGSMFPELKQQQPTIERVIRSEEESFGRTLERGLFKFHTSIHRLIVDTASETGADKKYEISIETAPGATVGTVINMQCRRPQVTLRTNPLDSELCVKLFGKVPTFSGRDAFELYATYGFPLDMTQLLAAERGLTVDVANFNADMEKHKEISDQNERETIFVSDDEAASDQQPTKFLGYTALESPAQLLDVVTVDKATYLVFDQTPFYAEMGGQAGDTGSVEIEGQALTITNTIKDKAGRFLHKLGGPSSASAAPGATATLVVDVKRRRAISRHHSAVHLLHWALRKVLGTHVRQAGTSKTPDRARFDFGHFEQVKPEQLHEIEHLVNEKVIDNATVEAYETDFDKKPPDTLAFFGEKYGKIVRVVDIGGYSRELCGGTHVATTGEIGVVKIVSEMAIAAGTRRIEIVAGAAAIRYVADHETQLKTVSSRLNAGPQDVVPKLESLLAEKAELEKQLKAFQQKAEAGLADELAGRAFERNGLQHVVAKVEANDPNALRVLGAQILGQLGEGVVILGAAFGAEKVAVVALCSPAAIQAGAQAGDIVRGLCAQLNGKGGGKPDFAMGGGKDAAGLEAVLNSRRG